jgi:hypothetical protein
MWGAVGWECVWEGDWLLESSKKKKQMHAPSIGEFEAGQMLALSAAVIEYTSGPSCFFAACASR